MRGETFKISTAYEFEVEECSSCGAVFAMTKQHMSARERDGDWFYCPNGHGLAYTESVEAQLKEARLAKQRYADEAARLRASNDGLLSEVAAKKREIGRMKKRAEHGVCQFCRRTFVNVARHVQNKHKGVSP